MKEKSLQTWGICISVGLRYRQPSDTPELFGFNQRDSDEAKVLFMLLLSAPGEMIADEGSFSVFKPDMTSSLITETPAH